MKLQSALRLIYPPQCLTCGAAVEDDLSLCGECWRETHFIHGLTCRSCGLPLPGKDRGTDMQCDDCMTIARPWNRGAAAMMYRGKGRDMDFSIDPACGGATRGAVDGARRTAR